MLTHFYCIAICCTLFISSILSNYLTITYFMRLCTHSNQLINFFTKFTWELFRLKKLGELNKYISTLVLIGLARSLMSSRARTCSSVLRPVRLRPAKLSSIVSSDTRKFMTIFFKISFSAIFQFGSVLVEWRTIQMITYDNSAHDLSPSHGLKLTRNLKVNLPLLLVIPQSRVDAARALYAPFTRWRVKKQQLRR